PPGRFHIVPSWLAPGYVADDPDDIIVLDPGRAFGSGHHATTVMCLELLDDCDRSDSLRGSTVADVGCGSGILAIAAARRGATVTAIDIDPDAIDVTAKNAVTNRVDLTTTHRGLDALTGHYDIVVANLLTDVIATHATRLAAATRRTLLVSGIADERRDVAFDALAAAGLQPEESRSRDGWTAAVWTSAGEPSCAD
ncbi:MAG: 50S ribosomal protein L11 methyltransferase, partial [Nitriliruptoraceae bacterium]